MATSTEPTIDPSKEYSPETIAAMQQAIAADSARKQALVAERNQRYKIKVDAVVASPEFAQVRTALASLATDEDKDDIYSYYVEAARINFGRMAGE